MRNTGRKVMVWLVIIFAAFYLTTRPQEAAGVVRGGAALLQRGFEALIQFFSGLA